MAYTNPEGAPEMDPQALAMTFTVGDDNYHLQKFHILRNGYQTEAKAWDTPRLGVELSGLSVFT